MNNVLNMIDEYLSQHDERRNVSESDEIKADAVSDLPRCIYQSCGCSGCCCCKLCYTVCCI